MRIARCVGCSARVLKPTKNPSDWRFFKTSCRRNFLPSIFFFYYLFKFFANYFYRQIFFARSSLEKICLRFVLGTEGRAGMASIMDPDRSVDMEDFYDGVVKMLVSYARPMFVRICNHIEVTGKHTLHSCNRKRFKIRG